jgi:hypothetical protein
MKRIAVFVLGASLSVSSVTAVRGAEPSLEPVQYQTLCVSVVAPPINDAADLRALLDAGLVTVLVAVPCAMELPEPGASGVPDAIASQDGGPYTRQGRFRYRWLPMEDQSAYEETPTMDVIADKGCAHGLRVDATDYTYEDNTIIRQSRVPAGKRVRLAFMGFEDQFAPRDIISVLIKCIPAPIRPWTRTYRGRGSDDRFVSIPRADEISGRFTVRASSSSGCITAVYLDDESIEEFDLFFDGRQTKRRTADIFNDGRTHLKVISSCPWTLTLRGRGSPPE